MPRGSPLHRPLSKYRSYAGGVLPPKEADMSAPRRSFPLFVAVLATLPALAYPIPPAPMWRQVLQSDAIVVATVLAVDEPEPAPTPKDGDAEPPIERPMPVARLLVVERW